MLPSLPQETCPDLDPTLAPPHVVEINKTNHTEFPSLTFSSIAATSGKEIYSM